MKFTVTKKGAKVLVPVTILYNVLGIIVLIYASFSDQVAASFVMIFLLVFLIVADLALIRMYYFSLCKVYFEPNGVRCKFLNSSRRYIQYDEIKEYGVFFDKISLFVCISRVELSAFQRENKAFQIYMKTKDVIVFEYEKKAMDFLDKKLLELGKHATKFECK